MNITQWLTARGISYTTSGKNVSHGWIGMKCPFCTDPSNHFGINTSIEVGSCFRCGEKAGIVRIIKEVEKVSWKEAFQIRDKYSHIIQVIEKKPIQYITEFSWPSGIKELTKAHKRYLVSRRYDPKKMEIKYQLRSAGATSEDYKGRLVIPIKVENTVKCFITRLPFIDESPDTKIPKYKASLPKHSIYSLKNCLYPIDFANRNRVAVVEGVFDAWRIGDGAVATFGTKFTEIQLAILQTFKEVFVLYDSEPTAQKQARKMAEWLSPHVEHIEIITLDEEDPDSLSDEDATHLRRELKL